MIIRAELKCKQTGCEADPCAVDKVIELPSPQFRQFSRALLADYDFIAENKNAMERPLLTPDELKSIPKGNFIVQKTGQHPMRTRLRLFLEWGITFEKPYIVPERADRAVAYANREDLERNLPQSNKAENADMRGAYAVSGRGGIAHEPAVDKPRRRGGKQMKTYGEEDL